MRILLLLFCLISNSLNAQDKDKKSLYEELYWGVEQDPSPYLSKGYFVSAWLGMQKTRLRWTHARAQTPKFLRSKGINYESIEAHQLAFDFFLKKDFRGFWIGPGVGSWWSRVQNKDGVVFDYQSFVFSAGLGYNIYLYKGWYLSPWLSGHLRLTGSRNIEVGQVSYQPRLLTPEISLKIGYRFGRKS